MPIITRMPTREKVFYKEIGWVLLIKLCLIIAIRILFFGHPHKKPDGVAITSAHLLGASAPASHSYKNTLQEAP